MKAIDWLAHFLVASSWEICFIGFVFAVLLACFKAAKQRHALAMLALALSLALPIATTVFGERGTAVPAQPRAAFSSKAGSHERNPKLDSVQRDSHSAQPSFSMQENVAISVRAPERFKPLVLLWLAGCLLMSLRLFVGWSGLTKLKRSSARAGEEWSLLAAKVAKAMGLKRLPELRLGLGIALSAAGFWRPVIYTPASLFGLSPELVEAAIAHEVAHLLRNDYLANVFQMLVESVLYYHPVIWAIGRIARREREHSCDDLAVAYLGDRRIYVSALAGVAGLSTQGHPELALGVSKSSLVDRARRVLGLRSNAARMPLWLAACSILTIGACAVALCQSPAKAVAAVAKQQRLFDIKVKLLDADGKPLAASLQANGTMGTTTQADTNGEADLKLEAGEYSIIFMNGYTVADDEWSAWKISKSGIVKPKWEPGLSGTFDGQQWIIRTPYVLVRGQVLDADDVPLKPRPHVFASVEMAVPRLYLKGDSYGVGGSATGTVDANGKFAILVQARSVVSPRFTCSIPGQTSDDGARIVNGFVTIHLHRVPKAWVTGRILDAHGHPYANAPVQIAGEGQIRSMSMLEFPKDPVLLGNQMFWKADSNGLYEIGQVNPGETLWVFVKAPKGEADAASEPVKISAGKNLVPTIKLVPANVTIHGKVVDWRGKSVVHARVRCWAKA